MQNINQTKMEELINRLLSGEGKLSLLLLEAKEYAENSKDERFIEFIDDELNGYIGKEIPEYRRINAEIVGDIQDSFGRFLHQQYPLDFSKISDQIGFDISTTVSPDGISFIENNLESLTKVLVLKKMPGGQVSLLNDILKYNNPGYILTAAYYRFGKASLQYILDKVRQELIIGLKKIQKSQKPVESFSMPVMNLDKAISVFVTYAWGGEDFNDLIISFVDFLRKEKGYNASMDRRKSQEETSTNFNRMMIEGIQNSDKVIVVLTEKYKKKADAFEGGVGTEYQLILEEIKTNTNKFVFVAFGDVEFDTITPTGIKGRGIIDLKKDQDDDFNSLISKLNSQNIIEFSEVKETLAEVKKKKIKPFKL